MIQNAHTTAHHRWYLTSPFQKMDHLPLPWNSAKGHLIVPYLCGGLEQYDGLGFQDYPVRQGWISSTQPRWYDCPPEDAARRAQSWLYFGLLSEFLGPKFDIRHFLRERTSRSPAGSQSLTRDVITTAKLQALLIDKSLYKVGPEKANSIIAALEAALGQCRVLEQCRSYSAQVVAFSIGILVLTLDTARCNHLENPWTENGLVNSLPSLVLCEDMKEAGFCPHWLQVFRKKYSVLFLYYIACLPCNEHKNTHVDCQLDRCVANNVDMTRYETKHVSTECTCDFEGPDIKEVVRLISFGSVPLIRCEEDVTGKIVLDVVEASSDIKYTSISHVWSGGLGNPSANSLPSCQLRKLKNAITTELRKAQPIYFWMDTLCVPLRKDHKSIYQKALNQMAFIYVGAQDVLVLDPNLQGIDLNQGVETDHRAYMVLSAWMGRCWTYQEARLARRLVFLTSNNRVYFPNENIIKEVKREWNIASLYREKPLEFIFQKEVASLFSDLEPVTEKDNRFSKFVAIWNGLASRSTTKREDLHGIIAIMADLSCAEILYDGSEERPLVERARAILKSQAAIPLSFLYIPSNTEMDSHPKTRWLPVYPTTPITADYGHLAFDSTGHPEFVGRVKPRIFLVCHDKKTMYLPQFCLMIDSTLPTSGIMIQTSSTPAEQAEEDTSDMESRTAVYMLHDGSSSDNTLVGARFWVQEPQYS